MKLTSLRTLGIALLAVIMIGGLSGCKKKQQEIDTGSDIRDTDSTKLSDETTTSDELPIIGTARADLDRDFLVFRHRKERIDCGVPRLPSHDREP